MWGPQASREGRAVDGGVRGGKWTGFTKGHFLLSSQVERSDGEEKRQRRGRRHTLLDLLFEFMHKSNNTKRKKKKQK